MRIRNITTEFIKQGQNWRVLDLEAHTGPLEDLEIEPCRTFPAGGCVVYSAVSVSRDGRVTPLVLIKEADNADYGGDYCELIDGRWRQVGLGPTSRRAKRLLRGAKEYVANPFQEDCSFATLGTHDDYRAQHRAGFARWAARL